tara:strand:- start:365 stop:721 length:357 start_codon:yes stop_codon:yes gene_type:complete
MDENPDVDDYNEDEYDVSDIIVESNNNEDINIIMKNYKKRIKTYQTTPLITKYEKTRVLSERASQINEGSNPLITHPDKYSNAYDIAVAEYNEKKIPFIIKRPYGNTYEYWRLADLIV